MMENNMTPEQKAARLALIKQVAEKRNAIALFKEKQKANAATVRRWTDTVEKPRRAAKAAEFDAIIEKLDENHNQWTDGPQYAKQYYGDVAYETTRFDNDWD
jgi:DNA-binding protein H-NS